VTLSSADAGIIEFGHRTTSEDPLAPDAENSTVLVVALENCIDWHEAIRDQAGRRHLVFRFALRGHQGGWDAPSALRFGWEDNNDLEAAWLPGGQGGDLPGGSHSFVQVSPPNVMLTTLKVAEQDGLIARLWEVSGQESRAAVAVRGLGSLVASYRTDALERGDLPVSVRPQAASFPVRAGGLATVRLLLAPGASGGAKEVRGME